MLNVQIVVFGSKQILEFFEYFWTKRFEYFRHSVEQYSKHFQNVTI